MEAIIEQMLLEQLKQRKQRLESALADSQTPEHLTGLLRDIDAALDKFSRGTYGICETCNESIEPDRLIVDPLVRNCLSHLSIEEQKLLERDLDLAYEMQTALLPKPELRLRGWDHAYHYEPAGPVSGDYLDIIVPDAGSDTFLFMVGDVSGKGVAASLLMSQLHGTLRTLAGSGLPLNQLVERANRVFCEGSLSSHFATLVSGSANESGEVTLCNAGHCRPIVVRGESIETMGSSGVPLGVVCNGHYSAETLRLGHGDCLVLYTDGLTEAANGSGELYDERRLVEMVKDLERSQARDIVSACLEDLVRFRGNARKSDDLTIMVLRRV